MACPGLLLWLVCVCLSVCLSVRPSIHLSVCLSVHVCVCVYVCLFVILLHWIIYVYREHAMLVKIAGVRHLVVLINKMDDPTVKWSEERYVYVCMH